MRPASLLGDNGYLGRVVMSKQSQHVLVTLPHPLLRLASLGLVAFIFTLFSLELSRYGAQLAPLWFPTSIMMVAFYRHAGKMWPGIALACSFGSIGASLLFFPGQSLNFSYTVINIIEAVVGAMLLRKLLPWYNPLQNLNDWARLAFGSAVVPPLLGGVLLWLLLPQETSLNTFLIWVLSESIGALALVVTGVLTEKQAYKAIDSQTIFIFGGTLALAKALEMTGAGKLVADHVIGLLGQNSSPFMLLVVVFALSVVMTNFMSNTATVALLVPVSLSIAAGMGADPRAVLMATVIGSSCAYATPIGMPANMMVLSAGGYKFVDYAKSGIPLIIVSTIVSLILLPILFPFHP